MENSKPTESTPTQQTDAEIWAARLQAATTITLPSAIEAYVTARFDPQPDITAYELAQLFPYINGAPLREADWVALGEKQRHLKRTN